MIKKILAVLEQVELFAINHPFMFQQLIDSIDDFLWAICPVLDSFIQWLCQCMLSWLILMGENM